MINQLIPPGDSNIPARIALLIVVLGMIFLLRAIIARLLAFALRRLVNQPTNNTLVRSSAVPLRLILLAVAIEAAARILLVNGDAFLFMRDLGRTLIILALFIGLYRAIALIMSSRSQLYSVTHIPIEDALLPLVRTSMEIVLIAILIVTIIQIWGYDVSGLITGLGLGGLAFSLAAQDTLSNLFGFSMIVGDRAFIVGEYIVTPDVEGTVERVGVRSTRIRQNNQAIVTVPNSRLANSNVLNWSRLSKRWIDIRLPLYYSTTADQIEELMRRIRAMMAERDKVDKDTIRVHLFEFSTNGLIIMVRSYVDLTDSAEFIQEREQIFLNLLRITQTMALEVAFPGQSVYIKQVPEHSQDIQAGLQRVETNRQTVESPAASDHQGEQP